MGQVTRPRSKSADPPRRGKDRSPLTFNDEDLRKARLSPLERARLAASIRHPNVVDVTDFGQSPDGVFFLVMEYVEGETLYHLLRREGTVTPQRAAAIMRQVVAGVEAAHDERILHRDLKPANIFLMQQKRKTGGDDGFVKVGDFGLAKIVNADRSDVTSASGPASWNHRHAGVHGARADATRRRTRRSRRHLRARHDRVSHARRTPSVHRQHYPTNRTEVDATTATVVEPRSDISDEVEATIMKALAVEPTSGERYRMDGHACKRPSRQTQELQRTS